jgi:hypothetical protein
MPTRPRPKRGMLRDEPRLRYRVEYTQGYCNSHGQPVPHDFYFNPHYSFPTTIEKKILQERINGIWVDVV